MAPIPCYEIDHVLHNTMTMLHKKIVMKYIKTNNFINGGVIDYIDINLT
jgi:hypothetical protein